MHIAARAVVSLLACVLVLSVSGCGLSSTPRAGSSGDSSAEVLQPPQTIWHAAQWSLKATKSARIHGTMVSSGTEVEIDVAGNRDGSNMKMVKSRDGWTAEILVVGDSEYIKGDAAYWLAAGVGEATIERIGTKYLKQARTTTGILTVGQLVFMDDIDFLNASTVTKSELSGTPVYVLTKRASDAESTAWVTVEEWPRVLRYRLTSAGGLVSDLTFSQWNAVPLFSAPHDEQVAAI